MEVKGVGRRLTQLLDDLGNRRRRKLKIEEVGYDNLLHEHKEEIQVIFQESIDLLIISIFNNNDDDNNNNNNNNSNNKLHGLWKLEIQSRIHKGSPIILIMSRNKPNSSY